MTLSHVCDARLDWGDLGSIKYVNTYFLAFLDLILVKLSHKDIDVV